MHFQLETLFEKGLQHLRHLVARGTGGQSRVNVEAVGGDPVGADYLMVFDLVGDANVVLDGEG